METDTTTNMSISFPESVREFIEEQVSAYGFGTASEYLRELVLQDKKRKEQEKLEAMLLKAMEGGTGSRLPRIIGNGRKRSLTRVAERRRRNEQTILPD